VEFVDLIGSQGTLATELLHDQGDLGEVLDGFHVHVGRHEIAAVGDHAVIGHENGVVIGDERLECLGEFGGSRRCVMSQRDGAEREQDFADERLIESESAGGKASCGGRMRMHDGIDVRTHAVDGHVHAEFAGDVAKAGDSATVHVHNEKVFGGHHTLAHAGRGNQNRDFVEPHGDIAVCSGNKTALVQHLAVAQDFQPGFVVAHTDSILRENTRFPHSTVASSASLHFLCNIWSILSSPIIIFVLVSDFDFLLPPDLIAQHPPHERASSRMLHLHGDLREDRAFSEFPELLRGSDLVVFNDTRVLPARLFGHRSGSRAQRLSPANPASREFLQGRVEVLLTRRLPGEEQLWQALVRPGKKIMPGERLYFGGEAAGSGGYAAESSAPAAGARLEAEVLTRGDFGERTLRFLPVPDFFARLEALGHIPLPPYIDREDTAEDRARYQTVFARDPGSVAAPTAGLHFTEEILGRLRDKGVETASVTLHVGLGTFSPIRTEVVEEHKIHTEWYQIPEETAEKIARARREGRRVVAIGTTTVRTLEYAAGMSQRQEQEQEPSQLPHPSQRKARMGHPYALRSPHITAHSGEANIFIYPGYRFRVVDAMLTNFHLPKSTLLMLVSAFAGRERVLAAYEHAVRERYRFFSYGDCMFIE